MTHQKALADRRVKPFGMSAWSIIGGVVLAAFAVAVIASIPDIKRYIRISTM